jgi:hypothetical protein
VHVKVAWSEGTCRERARSGMHICGGERVGNRSASTFREGCANVSENDKIEKPREGARVGVGGRRTRGRDGGRWREGEREGGYRWREGEMDGCVSAEGKVRREEGQGMVERCDVIRYFRREQTQRDI